MDLLNTQTPDKYPGLDDNDVNMLESNIGGLTQTQMYHNIIKERLTKQERDKKTAVKNAALYEGIKNNDKNLIASVKKADIDDSIIDLGRARLKERGIDDSNYNEQELISMFKQSYGINTYDNLLNGKISLNELVSSKKTSKIGESISDVGNVLSPLLAPALGIAALKGIKKGREMVPTEKKFLNVVNYIKTNLLQGGKIAPEFYDEKVKTIVDYLGSLEKGAEKQINKNKLGKIRGLYNQVVEDLSTVIPERTKILTKNANKWVGEEILNPLKDEINRLGKIGQFDDYTKGLQEVYNETKKLIDTNGGKILLDDAEKLKEIAYENVDYTKQANVAVTAKEMNKAKGYRLLGKGVKEGIETVVPEIKPLNMIYGKLKDISKSVGLESVKLERMTPYTTLGNLRKQAGQLIGMIPGISAVGNIQGDLSQKRIEEKGLGKVITRSKRFGEKIGKFIDKYGKVVSEDAPKTTEVVAKTEKTLRPGLKTLGKTALKTAVGGTVIDIASRFGPDPLAGNPGEGGIPPQMMPIAQKLIGKYKGQKEIPMKEIIKAGFYGDEIKSLQNEFKKRQTGVKPVEIKKGTAGIKDTLKKTAKTSLGL